MIEVSPSTVPWGELTPDEKMLRRLAAWLSTEGREFATPEAEEAYKTRVKRFADVVQLRIPDRVPVFPHVGPFAAYYAGFTERDMMYDADRVNQAARKFTLDFQPDARIHAAGLPGRALDTLNYTLYQWPGHGVSEDSGLQFVDDEYLKASEIDEMLEDPTDFWIRKYLPRTMGELGGFFNLFPFPYVRIQLPVQLARLGQPEVQHALEALARAGREALAFAQTVAAGGRELESMGFPALYGGAGSHAPFDVMAAALRGTREINFDLFRRPEKLLEAVERITPAVARMAMEGARMGASPLIMLPLHRGADGFMSDKHFRTFYWPQLRRVILALVEEGFVPLCFAEGGFNSRLEVVRDLPRGKVVWMFDITDMTRAKEVLGDVACVMGNVPVALLHTGTPDDVTAYCRKLIDTAGKDGGFILSPGAMVGRGARAENIRAMIDCAKEYGVYA